jgi:hypothetical protein
MTYKKIQEILRCAQILRCLKSKYLLFFPARRVFRYAGMDVSPHKVAAALTKVTVMTVFAVIMAN